MQEASQNSHSLTNAHFSARFAFCFVSKLPSNRSPFNTPLSTGLIVKAVRQHIQAHPSTLMKYERKCVYIFVFLLLFSTRKDYLLLLLLVFFSLFIRVDVDAENA